MTRGAVDRVVGAGVLVLAACAPLVFSNYWVSALLTQTLLLGIVAASLVFLSAYGGMISLAQVSLFGIAGFVYGNAVTNGNTKGLNLDWSPWLAIPLALVISTLIALLFGAIASRNVGIYFLMITLTFGVIANLFFGQVTTFSGFGGISGIPAPGFIGDTDAHPFRLYYVALVVSVAAYVILRFVLRTPFGVAFQGVRDDPLRMRTTPDECREIARILAGKLNAAEGPTVLFVPLRGVSAIATEGQVFHDAEADEALVSTLRELVDTSRVEVHELELDVNAPEFALAMANRLHELIGETR